MTSDVTVLAVDTSSEAARVALLRGAKVHAELSVDVSRHHAETLLGLVEMVLDAASADLNDVDLFAVIDGPGSFTGLRVGISTVKGFAISRGVPVAGISSLEALAGTVTASPGSLVCPLIDAKHGQVYASLYRIDTTQAMVRMMDEHAALPEELLGSIGGDVIFLGSGARIHKPLIRNICEERASFANDGCERLTAGIAGLIGLKKFIDGDIVNPILMTPRYVRTSYAEIRRVPHARSRTA